MHVHDPMQAFTFARQIGSNTGDSRRLPKVRFWMAERKRLCKMPFACLIGHWREASRAIKMNRIKTITLMVALTSFLAFPSVGASSSVQYCMKGDYYQPSGVIVRVETRYFHFCSGGYWHEGDREFITARSGPSGTALQRDANTTQQTVSVKEGDFSLLLRNSSMLFNHEGAPRTFGGVEYRVRFLAGPLDKVVKGFEYDAALFIFEPDQTQNLFKLPMHFVSCSGLKTNGTNGLTSCFMHIEYRDVVIREMFFDGKVSEGKLIKRTIDFASFPSTAATMVDLATQIDVTDRIEDFRGHVKIIE